ncbi:MAG: hypothetical protein M1820_009635 [Bogoriella megaspora]|nr:MAG: hypothetical protein M1820_009635 [Bogoriella megaspora]
MAAQDYYNSFSGQQHSQAPASPHPSQPPPPYSPLPQQQQQQQSYPPPSTQQQQYRHPPQQQQQYPPPPTSQPYPQSPSQKPSTPYTNNYTPASYQNPSSSQSQYLAPPPNTAPASSNPQPGLSGPSQVRPQRSHSSPPDDLYATDPNSTSRGYYERPHKHRHHSHSGASKSHKNRDTFLGGGAGAIVGDAIFPGLGTVGGLLLGGWGGYDRARRKDEKRELDERLKRTGHGGRSRSYDDDEEVYRRSRSAVR